MTIYDDARNIKQKQNHSNAKNTQPEYKHKCDVLSSKQSLTYLKPKTIQFHQSTFFSLDFAQLGLHQINPLPYERNCSKNSQCFANTFQARTQGCFCCSSTSRTATSQTHPCDHSWCVFAARTSRFSLSSATRTGCRAGAFCRPSRRAQRTRRAPRSGRRPLPLAAACPRPRGSRSPAAGA